MTASLSVVQIGSFGTIGDNVYRVHEPAAALASLPGVQVYEVNAQSRQRNAAALAADVLVVTMTLDIEVHRLIAQRRLLGKPTIAEVNDWLPDVQAWNPASGTWADARGLHLFKQLIANADSVQVTTQALAERVAPWAKEVVVFANQLAQLPLPRPARQADAPLVIGWGGSIGHRQDIAHIAPTLCAWLQRHPQARLAVMGEPALAGFFSALSATSPAQFTLHAPGALVTYLAWLQTIDIGLAPLLPTDYNRCRSDVKFLEYAASGVVPVLQALDPYSAVRHGDTGFVFNTPQELTGLLDRLAADPALRQQVAANAYQQVATERRMAQHAPHRLDFYRQRWTKAQVAHAAEQTLAQPPAFFHAALLQAGQQNLAALPGWQTLCPQHHRMDAASPAEQHCAQGIDALQTGQVEQACQAFQAALRLDPSDAQALSWLGHCLLAQGRLALAQQALERACALDPLASRPVRTLTRLHSSAAHHYARQASALNPLIKPVPAASK